MVFRVRKTLTWAGQQLMPGDLVEIDENHPRIGVLVGQSHHLEYANRDNIPPEQVAVQEVRNQAIKVSTSVG